MQDIVIAGTGGLAREFTEFFRDQVRIRGYISTDPAPHKTFGLPGEMLPLDCRAQDIGCSLAVIAIGTPAAKAAVRDNLLAQGFTFPVLIHPHSVVAGNAQCGDGVVVSPNCTVGAHVSLGKHDYLNFNSAVGHDAVLGDFVQVNPGAQVGGGCKIGAGSLIGSNATILQDLTVNERATVGSGAVVMSRVRAETTVVGNPARRMSF